MPGLLPGLASNYGPPDICQQQGYSFLSVPNVFFPTEILDLYAVKFLF
jgi:hypothetical protein